MTHFLDYLNSEKRPVIVFDGATGTSLQDQQLTAADYLSLIHISEPTRLRRISYAVFCLKKKNR